MHLFRHHKNNKFLYYFRNYLRLLIPSFFYQSRLQQKLSTLTDFDKEVVYQRLNYYNKLDRQMDVSPNATKLSEIKIKKGRKTYFFDLKEYSRYFNQNLKGIFLFGDIIETPDEPTFVKSRPIAGDNKNAVLLKWGKVRHFTYIKYAKHKYEDKKDMLVSRGHVYANFQPHRIRFLEKYMGHPMCNIGMVNADELNPAWKVERMTFDEQLAYKFILCLEGNDVASNLKWVMSSNSLAVMPQPKFETWFMEGALIPNHHYVSIKDDYSDLEERLKYYINNPDEAQQIIKNANDYIAQFKNKPLEDLISLMVLEKYFIKTNQLPLKSN